MKPMLLAVLAAAIACSPTPAPDGGPDSSAAAPVPPAPAPVALTLDRDSYAPGDPVTLTLTNSGSGQYYFNPCQRSIERESNGTWALVDEQRMCTMEAWILEPNGTRTAPTELPASVAPGRYRIVVALTREGEAAPAEAVRAVSAPFTVGG